MFRMVREQHYFPQFIQYSRILGGEERIHENILVKEPITGAPCTTVTTMYEALKRAEILTENGDFLGEIKNGKYEWKGYSEILSSSRHSGCASVQFGAVKGARAGLAGVQSVNYEIAMFGLISRAVAIVPLYHNSKVDVLCEIVNNCNLELIFCDSDERTDLFVQKKKEGQLPTVRTLVTLNTQRNTNSDLNNNKMDGLTVMDFSTFLRFGEENPIEEDPPKADDVYIICHTSGTTGRPKGVQLSHGNLLCAMGGLYTQWCTNPHHFQFGKGDTFFSFLSLAHIYEHLMQSFMIYVGGRIGIYSGDVKQLIPDIQLLKPTIISLVPRILNRLYDQVHSNVSKSHFLAKKLFASAKKAKIEELRRGILNPNTMWDKLVFEKIRLILGGSVRLLTTGGAPVTPSVHDFTRIAFGCPLFEGYGQTECGAAGTLNLPGDLTGGHVGAPAPWAQVKLIDAPELGYLSSEEKGEVCFRGGAVMRGYYGDDELTEKTIDKEGWLHTGDIGQWLPDGRLLIIDRKNALFKLSQGDFVSPDAVESVYLLSEIINQIFVTGQTTRSFLIAIAVVDCGEIRKMIEQKEEMKGLLNLDDTQLLENDEVKRMVCTHLSSLGREKGLQTIEQIKHIHMTTEEWTAESGLLTPTLKIRRHPLKEKFHEEIEALYALEDSL